MNQDQLRCQKVGHNNQFIQGICMDQSCQADQKIACLSCLQTIHAKCMTQFNSAEQFIHRLQQLKLRIQKEDKLVIHAKELIEFSTLFIKDVHQLANNIINSRDIQVNRIEQILNKQNLLSTNDWKEGYLLLTKQIIAAAPSNTQSMIIQLDKLKQMIDQLTMIQSLEQIDLIKQTSAQQLIKSDWNNITPQKPLIIEAKNHICTIALSPCGKYVASAGEADPSIQIWNPITGKQFGNDMNGHTCHIKSINYSKCGKYIVSGSYDKTIRRWSVQTQLQIDLPMNGHEDAVRGVQYTPDQRYIVSCSFDRTIRLWSSETGKEHVNKRIRHGNVIYCMSLSPISNDVAFGDNYGMIKIYDYERHQLSGQSLNGHTQCIMALQYSVDGQYIVSGGYGDAIILWNAISRQQIASFLCHKKDEYGPNVWSVSFSPDTKYIISGGFDKTVRIWDRVNGKQIGEPLTHHTGWVWSTQFSLDGKYIITGGADKSLRIMVAPMGQ